ncbi:ACT domain-containing protein [Pseudomonadota bacterium]
MKVLNIVQEDHPGLLAEVATVLEREGIVVQDFSGQSVGNTAVISLTTDRYEEAFRLLSDAGYRVIASEHLLVRLEKKAGALAELSRRLAEQNINVRGMHIVNKDEKTGIVALETADGDKAREVLKDILV